MNNEEYKEAIAMLARGDTDELEAACHIIEGFPSGKDRLIERHWITNAIDCGSLNSVEWMISKGVELKFRDDEGLTPLHSCISRRLPDKYEILDALILAGADVNAHDMNDYTPLHLATISDDRKAIRMLVNANADTSVRTRIDHYATAEEEARILGRHESANFLASLHKS